MSILQIIMIKNIFLCIGHTRKLEVGDIFENIIVQFQTNASFHLLNTVKLYFVLPTLEPQVRPSTQLQSLSEVCK